jgi:hypothetical protein
MAGSREGAYVVFFLLRFLHLEMVRRQGVQSDCFVLVRIER